jgi:hypothetical protein
MEDIRGLEKIKINFKFWNIKLAEFQQSLFIIALLSGIMTVRHA